MFFQFSTIVNDSFFFRCNHLNNFFLTIAIVGSNDDRRRSLIFLISARHQRATLRHAVKEQDRVSLVFLVAESSDLEVQEVVQEEHRIHRDLLQVSPLNPSSSFLSTNLSLQVSDPESYTRLAYKTLSGFLWAASSCSQVRQGFSSSFPLHHSMEEFDNFGCIIY